MTIFGKFRNTLDRLRLAVDVLTAAIDRQTQELRDQRHLSLLADRVPETDSDRIHDYDRIDIMLWNHGGLQFLHSSTIETMHAMTEFAGMPRTRNKTATITIILPEGTTLPDRGTILVQ